MWWKENENYQIIIKSQEMSCHLITLLDNLQTLHSDIFYITKTKAYQEQHVSKMTQSVESANLFF